MRLGVSLRGSAWLKDKNEILKMSDMSLWAAATRECDMVAAQHVPHFHQPIRFFVVQVGVGGTGRPFFCNSGTTTIDMAV